MTNSNIKKYHNYAAILLRVDNTDKEINFKKWLFQAFKSSRSGEKYCDDLDCVYGNENDQESGPHPCENIKLLNAARLPGAYDYLIEIVCLTITDLECFVNECLLCSNKLSKIIKDSFTYVGVPLLSSEFDLKHHDFVGELCYDMDINGDQETIKSVGIKLEGDLSVISKDVKVRKLYVKFSDGNKYKLVPMEDKIL